MGGIVQAWEYMGGIVHNSSLIWLNFKTNIIAMCRPITFLFVWWVVLIKVLEWNFHLFLWTLLPFIIHVLLNHFCTSDLHFYMLLYIFMHSRPVPYHYIALFLAPGFQMRFTKAQLNLHNFPMQYFCLLFLGLCVDTKVHKLDSVGGFAVLSTSIVKLFALSIPCCISLTG